MSATHRRFGVEDSRLAAFITAILSFVMLAPE
jgi:hypothetical protein